MLWTTPSMPVYPALKQGVSLSNMAAGMTSGSVKSSIGEEQRMPLFALYE